ncbi:MAG: glycosyl hydrolase [Rikenellaceae bacterium]
MRHLLIILSFVTICSCSQSSPEHTPREELMQLLDSTISQTTIMFGRQDDTAYGHSWCYEPNRSDVLEMVGDYPAIIGWDIARIEFADSVNIDGVSFSLMRELIREHHRRGGVNTISWHAYNPIDNSDSWQKEAGVVSSIIEGGEHHDKLMANLERVADYVLSLTDDQGRLIPIIFRPWHEHTGSWFWWGRDFATPDEWRALWDITYDYFALRGLDNIVWAVSPSGGTEHYEERIPAIDRFDIYGVDCYHYNGEQGVEAFQNTLRQTLALMQRLGEQNGKPIALTECGFEGVGMERWWTDVLYDAVKEFPLSYLLVWRSAWDRPEHFYCSFKGHSSEANFIEFYNNPQIIFNKELNDIR